MRKPILYFIVLLVILFSASLFLVSCKSQQPIQEKTVVIENNQRVIDSLRELLINKAIEDKLNIKVPGSNTGNANLDSIVNKAVADILSKINYSKTSGDNSFEILYDALKRELVVNAKVGQTTSSNTKVTDTKTSDKTIDKIKEVPVNKPYTKLEKTLMCLGLLVVLFLLYRAIVFFRSKFQLIN